MKNLPFCADCGHAQEGYFNYNRLWTLLIDKGITKTQMHLQTDICTNILAKMRKDEPIAMEILTKITTVLHCGLDDIVEINADEKRTGE